MMKNKFPTQGWGQRRRQKAAIVEECRISLGTEWSQLAFGACACGQENWLYAPTSHPKKKMCGLCVARVVMESVPERKAS